MEKKFRFSRSGLRRCGWAALFMLLIIQACVPKKHLVSRDVPGAWVEANAAERQQFFDRLTHYQVDFHSINARAKGFLTINDQENHEVNVQLRMRDGEAIWASITSFLGMEVGRLLLTPDSIRVINRIDKKFLVRHYSTLHDLVGQDISFAELQQLLIGNIPDTAKALKLRLGLFTEGGVLKDNQSDWGDLSVATELHFNHNFRLVTFRSTQNPSSQHQDTSTRGGSVLEATHTYPSGQSEVEQAVQRDHPGFPNKTSIAVQGPRLKLIATLDYNRVILDQPVEMPFNIPKGYSQIH